MGIQGLLPFLKKASTPSNIKNYKGCTVAIDSYCWLHKGAFACADKLALGEPTDQYVYYCMKYVNSLLAMGVKPVMVFDGCRLPSKELVETQRRERRSVYKKKAAAFLREGKRTEARECLQRCVDVTPQMALELMKSCRSKGVDCIVAPYEADAQLAFLSRSGIAQVIITEDSDLLLFGCERVMFKMDFMGNGVLIERDNLIKGMDLRPDVYTFDKFRYMCILSGCDYLPSLSGIGLVKACKVFKLTRQSDLKTVLKKMPTILKMPNLNVTDEYIEGFFKANNTFLHQLVFDPRGRQIRPCLPYPDTKTSKDFPYCGTIMPQQEAYQLALGNIDINTRKYLYDFNPDTYKPDSRCVVPQDKPHLFSIWDPQYRPMKRSADTNLTSHNINRSTTSGKESTAVTPKQLIVKSNSVKRQRNDEDTQNDSLTESDLRLSYLLTPSGETSYTDGVGNDSMVDSLTDNSKRCRVDSSSDGDDSDRLIIDELPDLTEPIVQTPKLKLQTSLTRRAQMDSCNHASPSTSKYFSQPTPKSTEKEISTTRSSGFFDELVKSHVREERCSTPKSKNPFMIKPKISPPTVSYEMPSLLSESPPSPPDIKTPEQRHKNTPKSTAYQKFRFDRCKNPFRASQELSSGSSPSTSKPFKPVANTLTLNKNLLNSPPKKQQDNCDKTSDITHNVNVVKSTQDTIARQAQASTTPKSLFGQMKSQGGSKTKLTGSRCRSVGLSKKGNKSTGSKPSGNQSLLNFTSKFAFTRNVEKMSPSS